MKRAASRAFSVRRLFYVAVCLLATGVFPSANAAAPARAKKNTGAAVARVEWKKLMGRVIAFDRSNHRLQLRDRNGNITHVIVDRDVQIFRDWRLIDLKDVNEKDRVILKRSASQAQ